MVGYGGLCGTRAGHELIQPPPNGFNLNKSGNADTIWKQWFQSISRALSEPFVLRSYTVSNVPDASRHEGAIIYISDEIGGAVVAFSDGTDWRRVTDRTVIS